VGGNQGLETTLNGPNTVVWVEVLNLELINLGHYMCFE
jgi:hypothetical protein